MAPSVTRDAKEWFEGAGWIQSSEWPNVARGLLQFIRNAVEKPQSFRANCRNFDESFPHKGFQVGMLSPILNALLPEEYPVVNNKPVAVINWLTGAGYRTRIKDMPDVIESIKQWVTHNSTYFEPLIQQGLNVYDTFDIFCHWLKAVKKHPLRKAERNTRYEEFGRGSAHAAAKVFEKMFPDQRNSKSVFRAMRLDHR